MSDTQFIRRSDVLLRGPHRAPARAMLKASGFDDEALGKPIIGVANTWIEIGPCNHHLRELAAAVKDGIRAAGGTPMEFNTVSINDGITMGTDGMRASLVSREVIADSIELVARGYAFDGVIALCGCDKTIPGTTMAVARLGIPGLVLYGGSIAPGTFHGPRRHDPGRVRGRRRPRVRPHDRRGPARHRGSRLPGLRRLRRPVHGEHDGHRRRVPRRRADGQRLGAGDATRARPTSGRRAGALVMDLVRQQPAAARDPHARGARERDRLRRVHGRLDQRRPAPARDRARGRRAARHRRLRPDQPRRAAARRPEAWRPLRRHRSLSRRAASRSWPSGCSRRDCCTRSARTVSGRTIGEEAAAAVETPAPGRRPSARRTRSRPPADSSFSRATWRRRGAS